ncbi:MAG: hypothetical protein QXR69_00195 [Conexivisphaerales archaeon]
MGLISAFIMPHGSEAVPKLSDAHKNYARLTENMFKIANLIKTSNPETIILATPHNLRIYKQIGIIMTEYYSGFVKSRTKKITVSFTGDRKLAETMYRIAHEERLNVALVNYGTDSGTESKMPLDWGSVIPLWFLMPANEMRLVLVTPSREVQWQQLVDFGKCIRRAADQLGRRVSFIASADQAHAHLKSGPYGFSESAKLYDKYVLEYIRSNMLEKLLTIDPEMVDRAKPDSLWQMLILAGVLSGTKSRLVHLSYHRPSYFGMICAGFLLQQ